MKITFFEDRSYSKDYLHNEGTEFENKATTLVFDLPETLEDKDVSELNKYIVFDIEGDENKDILTPENTYVLPNSITELGKVKFNLYLVEAGTGQQGEDLFQWISKEVVLNFNKATEAKEVIVTEQEIDIFNSLVTQLNSKITEITLLEEDFVDLKKDYEELNADFQAMLEDLQQKIDSGYFDGKDATINGVNTLTIEQGDNIVLNQSGSTLTIGANVPTKTSQLQNDSNFAVDSNYVHTDNNYTNEEKNKLAGLENYDDTQIKADISDLSTNKADKSEIPDVSGFITKDVNNLTNYTLKTNTGSLIDLEINQSNYVVSLKLKDIDGNVISSDNIDLPLESVVVGGSYDATNKKIVLTLENGNTVDIPVGDLIAGLQTEITSTNKLASDLVDDSNSGNKFVTTTEKSNWNNKLDESDLTDYVKNTDYATTSKGGVIKSGNGTFIGGNGSLFANEFSYSTYSRSGANIFIGKGTLENVITGKGLIDSSSDITGNASTSTTLKSFNYNRNGTNNTWAKVATASLVKTWEEKHAYLFVKGIHSTNFKQNGIISIDAVGNAIKSKVNSYSAQFISASADLNLENFYIEYQDGDENTNATINFWVKNTTSAYASWQFKILQNTGWTIESAYTSVTTLPTQNFTGKISELNNKTLNDKDGNDITTTYVKNTDYATDNIAGVIKSGNAFKVANSGSPYVEELTYGNYQSYGGYSFISKSTLENVITGKELVNQTILDQSQATQDEIIAKLKADHPPIEEEGTDLSLQGTGDFDLALSPKGNITQETTTGKNKIGLVDGDYSQNGVTAIVENGILKINGTSSSDLNIYIPLKQNVTLANGGTNTFECRVLKGTISGSYDYAIRLLTTNYAIDTNSFAGTFGGLNSGLTHTQTADQTFSYVFFYGISGKTTNAEFGYQLETGSTATSWEKYTGGIASPNPSYPSPVKVIDGEYEVKVENKNLFDWQNIPTTAYTTNNSGVFSNINKNSVMLLNTDESSVPYNYFSLKADTYSVSFDIISDTSVTLTQGFVCTRDDNDNNDNIGRNLQINLTANQKTKVTITNCVFSTNRPKVGITLYFSASAYFTVSNIQFEKGTSATPYVAHQHQTQTIDTSPNPLYSEDDYYYKSSGKWFVHNEWGKVVLNGSERGGRILDNNQRIAYNSVANPKLADVFIDTPDSVSNLTPSLSTHFSPTMQGRITATNNSFGFSQWGGQKYIYISAIYDNIEDFKNWLSTHNTTFYYVLETPTNTPITNTTLINQLEALANMTAYQDQTNISQTHNVNQTDMIINAKTIMSLKYMQKEIENLSSRLALLE